MWAVLVQGLVVLHRTHHFFQYSWDWRNGQAELANVDNSRSVHCKTACIALIRGVSKLSHFSYNMTCFAENTLACVLLHVRLRLPLSLQFYSVLRLKCDMSVGTAVRWQHFNSSSMQPVCSQCPGILSSCRVILFSEHRPSTWMSVDIRLLQDRCVFLSVFGDLLLGAAVHIWAIVISQLFYKIRPT